MTITPSTLAAVKYKEPQEFAQLLFECLRSDANPDQRDEAAREVCRYMADVLKRLDELEADVSDAETFDPMRLSVEVKYK